MLVVFILISLLILVVLYFAQFTHVFFVFCSVYSYWSFCILLSLLMLVVLYFVQFTHIGCFVFYSVCLKLWFLNTDDLFSESTVCYVHFSCTCIHSLNTMLIHCENVESLPKI